MAFVGRRNIAYVVLVALLVPFGMLMEAAGPQGLDSGGGIMATIILWSVVSLIFFIANAGLAIGSIARRRSATKPLIACALPIVCIILPLLLEPFFVRFYSQTAVGNEAFDRLRPPDRMYHPPLAFVALLCAVPAFCRRS